jgi:hypothetical protein
LFAEILVKDKETVAKLFSGIPAEDLEATRRTLETLLGKLSRGE